MEFSEEIQQYLERIARKDFRCDLKPMREACCLLDNPERTYATIHIAGTNGKGSTAAFLSSILSGAGLRTGLMTSPHLVSVCERIKIFSREKNSGVGENISAENFTRLLQKIRPRLPEEEFLSYFEMITLAGFQYFSEMEVDVAVIETGLGGRLDATNVIQPQIGILTPISLDHENYLGRSLTKIAREKCGILKRGMSLVSAPQTPEVCTMIEQTCRPLQMETVWAEPSRITMPLSLAGEHQKINAACAWAAARGFLGKNFSDSKAAAALHQTQWPGRLTLVQKNPTVIVDGAHNIAGVEMLAQYLRQNFGGKKIHFLIGALRDKNWETMFQPLAALAHRFISVTPRTKRGLMAAELATALSPYGKPVAVRTEQTDFVFQSLLWEIPKEEMLVATGSLHMIGELLKAYELSTP